MPPLRLAELRSANLDILNTDLGGIINAGAARAEFFNRTRINVLTGTAQTERPNQRNETVIVEMGDNEPLATGGIPPVAAATAATAAGVPTAQHRNVAAVAAAGVPTAQHRNERNQTNLSQLDRQDKERREKNLIVTGICETNHEGDWEVIHQMLNYLGSQHRERQIVRMVRLGKKT